MQKKNINSIKNKKHYILINVSYYFYSIYCEKLIFNYYNSRAVVAKNQAGQKVTFSDHQVS